MRKFNVIYADPPWKYSNKRTGGSMSSGSEAQYKTMSIDELCALNISEITSNNAVLFLWITKPLLVESATTDKGVLQRLLNSWNFNAKSMITWKKTTGLGMGFWVRCQQEHLLICTRGDVKPFRSVQKDVVHFPRGSHSEKPDGFRNIIENLTKNLSERNMLELFARKKVDNWTCWGLDIDGISVEKKIHNFISMEKGVLEISHSGTGETICINV